MKKKRFISILLLIIVCALPVICIVTAQHLSLVRNMERMEAGILGESSCLVNMALDTCEKKIKIYEKLQTKGISCGIYVDDQKKKENKVRYMAFTESYPEMPMLRGRFFQKDDFKKENRIAIAGKNAAKKNIYKKDGQEYIRIGGAPCRVIGVIGYEEDTAFDDYVFANLFACDDDTLKVYTFDFLTNIDDAEATVKVSETVNAVDPAAEIIVETEKFADTLKVDLSLTSYFAGLFLCYMLCTLLISWQWVDFQRREMGIRRIIGASKSQIGRHILIRYLAFLAVSFAASGFYCKIRYPSLVYSFCLAYLAVIAILLIFMVIVTQKIKKDTIGEVIR